MPTDAHEVERSIAPGEGRQQAGELGVHSEALAEEESALSSSPGEDQGEDEGSQDEDSDAASVSRTRNAHPDSNGSPLPYEEIPPLPNEIPPPEDDGWQPVWDGSAQAFYFHNRFTRVSQWKNPRVPALTTGAPPGVGSYDRIPPAPGTESSVAAASSSPPPQRIHGGYNPAIHGDYDPTASYAQDHADNEPFSALRDGVNVAPGSSSYAATGSFNRFTGKWQSASLTPENFNDENKSKRQMNAFFDVDMAANSHDGRSLRAERAGKKLSKKEVKAFKDKRREKKEEKRRAWLRD